VKQKDAVLNIVQDAKSHIWVATSATGLWRFDGVKWTNHLQEEGSINTLAVTSDGRVWICSQIRGGLRYWDGEAWQVSLDSPLPIRCVIETGGGDIWAGGVLDGVHILRRQDR
jgi:ligand-binding sensor domain-containing protein